MSLKSAELLRMKGLIAVSARHTTIPTVNETGFVSDGKLKLALSASLPQLFRKAQMQNWNNYVFEYNE